MSTIPNSREPFEPELILVPGGEFLMGSDPEIDKEAKEDELPQHQLTLPDYAIAKTPVTNGQYAAFLKATNHTPPAHWKILFWKKRRLLKNRGLFCVSYSTLGAGRHFYCIQCLSGFADLSGSSFLCPERGVIFQLVWLGGLDLWFKSRSASGS